METLSIEILNPKVKKLIKDLAELKLISIKKMNSSQIEFRNLLKNLRSNSESAPLIDEITAEVEKVRTERYETQKN